MRHLTQDQLIQYQFDLLSEAQAQAIRDHLDSCPDCRHAADQLKLKFASLDLLAEDAQLSPELIAATVAQATKAGPPRSFPFRKLAWIGSAAAVLLIGLFLLKSDFVTGPKPDDRISPTSGERIADVKQPPPPGVITFADRFAGITTDKPDTSTLSEKPPFAPASAIELVVLPRRDDVQITIYNSADLTLVRERRNLTLKKGWNWLQFMWANTLIDPTSLHIEPLAQADKIDVQQLVFPAHLKDIGRWLIHSETTGQVPFEITYFTSGLNWRAFYMGTLSPDQQHMKLQAYVRVGNSSGEDYENAQTRLIVGKVHQLDQIADLAKRQYPYGRPGQGPPPSSGPDGNWLELSRRRLRKVGDVKLFFTNGGGTIADLKEIKKEGLSEYFLYTIEGKETIPNQWAKRLQSFDVDDIPVKSLYKYDEDRWGYTTIRFISFANDEDHELGQTPLPNGSVRIFSQADPAGHLSYIGGAGIKYIPVNEEIELNVHPARLVSVKRILMDFKADNYVFDRHGNIVGLDEHRTWKIDLANARDLPVDLEITPRDFQRPYWTIQTPDDPDIFYTKHDSTHARFKLSLAPHSKRAFTYTVTTYLGQREQAVDK